MLGSFRTTRWQAIAVAFSLVASLVVVLPSAPARAATLSVPGEFATIQAAVTAAQPGDVIEVAPGTYSEPPIVFPQSITIVGTGTRAEQVVVTSNTTGTAMLTVPSGVSVSIQNLELSGTSGGTVGGAVLNSGNIDLVGVVISGNSATANGGAISNQSGTARLISSLVANNTAPTHGGLHNFGTLVISNTTITGNSSPTGSVILNGGSGTIQINNSTIVGNSGVALGGVAGISVSNSILAGNSTNDCGAGVSTGHNIIQNNFGCSIDPTDLLGIDPDLGPLSDNDGTTDSFLPGLTSPAIDAGASVGAPPGCFTTDQRGVSRPQGDACDIGSVEVEQAPPPATPIQDLIDASIASGGNETIIVPPGVYNESIAISSNITLVGGGATASDTVIDASGLGTRTVTVGGNAAFENLTITGGTSGTQGGNITNDSADLTLTNVIVSNGTAQSGANVAAAGGATVTIVDSTISGGQASNGGGGISIASGSDLQVIGSVIFDNSAAFGNGGGIAASGSTVTIDGSTLINNSAGSGTGRGGALYADENSIVDIVDATIENNTAGLGGGAYAAGPMVVAQSLFNSNAATFPDGSTGGGIGGTGTISVANSTFQANTSAGNGGGVGIISGVTTMNNVTLTQNGAAVAGGAFSGDPGATIRIGNSLSAGNTNIGGGPDCTSFVFESLGHNVLEGAPGGCTLDSTDIVSGPAATPAPLDDNGGPTLTRALGDGHPAIDAGGLRLDYPVFDSTTLGDWQLNGFTDNSNGEILLAAPAPFFTVGSAFLADPVPVAEDFVARFDFRIDPLNAPDGADGITFTITDRPNAANGAGGLLGLSDSFNEQTGVRTGAISGVSVEFDTFQNGSGEGANDINGAEVLDAFNHIGINVNGNVSSVANNTAPIAQLDDGSPWTALVEYTASTKTLDVYAAPRASGLPSIPTVSTVLEDDIATLLDNSIGYVGFTGATGTENISGFQQILNFSFDSGPACEATDQRGVIRPQGSRCDVGAFELEVTPQGTVLSELEVDTFGDTTLESGFSVALGDIPSERLLAGASAIVGAPLGAIELDAPVDAAPLGAIGLDATPLGAIPLGAIPLGAIPLGAIPLGAINLMDLPIDGGWDAVLLGTTLEGRPPQTVTIEEVFDQVPADQLAEVRLAQLDPTSSAFGDVSVGSLLLGTIPISVLDPLDEVGLQTACTTVDPTCDPTIDSPLSLELTGSSLAASPLGAIPLGAIPLGAIPLGAIGTEAAPLGAIPLGAIPLGAIPLGASGNIEANPLGAIPLGAIGDLAAAPLGAIPLGAIPLGAIPLGAIPLGAIPLGAIPLGAIDANGDGAVGDVCAFLDADASAQSCSDLGFDDNSTLEDYVDAVGAGDLSATPLGAIPLGAIPLGAIPLGAIDITGIPLGAIQLGAIELAETPLGAIPLGAIPLGAIAFSDVCAAVTDASVTCDGDLLLSDYLAATGASTLGATPLGAITLETLPLGAIPLGAIPLGAISVAGVPLGAIPLGAIDLQNSPLGAIPLGAIPLGAIADSTTGATTLAEAIPLGAILADTPLGAIEPALDADLTLTLDAVLDHLTIAFLGETGGFGDLTLADVLVGILLSSDFPWEDLPLDEIEVRDIACAAVAADVGEDDLLSAACTGDVDTLDVGVNFVLDSGDLGGVEARVTIPSDWAYLAESAWLDSGSDLFEIEPTIEGSDLVFALLDTGALGGSNISLRFSVYAGYQLGTGTISALVTGQDSPDLNATSPTIDVVDGLEPSSLVAPTTITDDTLYVGYVGSSTDVDGFSIPSAGEGFRTTVFLSNLDQDVDTFIYRPESAPLSGDGTERAIPLGSTPVSDSIDFGGNTQLEPELQGDSPVAASTGQVLADSSTNTGTGGEELSILDADGETYTIQVAGFQGASSDRPYTLRVKRTAEAAQPTTCSPRAYTSLAGSGATIGTNTVTLFLTNPTRFDDIYGAGSWNTASAQLATLAARPEVGGQIVDIADIPGVAAAFGDWDADPCDVSAANDIVGAIQVWIQDNAPDSLRHVTIIGADEIVPFARAEDETVVANESTYAGDFGGSPLFSALTTRHYLTDAPYGDFDPIPWVGTKYAYITDLSVGRLVEDATHIAGAIQTYIDNGGVLSPTTAAVASYDFLYDGATLLADRLDEQLGGPVTDRTLMDDPSDPTVTDLTAWTDADLQALINGVPDIISPNSHYDHYRLLPSRENLNETENDLFTIADLPAALDEVIIFTMGCHSGLNVDGSIGTAVEDQDWPEVYSALNAIYIGNTGYGYGDSATVALTESIMANLAGNLDGTLTIGQALTQAKQDQFSKAGLYGVYDLKAIEEATLYGLPFWQIDVPGGGPASPADPVAGPTGTDPISGLTAASFSIDPDFGDPITSINGTYWAVDGEVEYLQWRPIQPRTGVDITKDGLIATGAIFTDLVTSDNLVSDAAFARPMTVSSTQREPEVETPGIVFPTGFTTVGTGNRVNPDPDGPAVEQIQRLNLIPGQFQGNATGPGGTQRLFEEIDGTVFYQPVANVGSIDWTRPFINDVAASTSGNQAQFTVDTNDPDSGISRATVLYRSGVTTWTSVNLTQQGASDTWTGGGLFGTVTPPLDYFVFSVNGDGVTSVSTFKGGLYETETGTTPIDPVEITGPAGDVQGVYQGTVTVTGPAGVAVTLDGASRTFPFDVTGDGPHVVVVDGGPTVNFVIDGNAPTVFVPIGTPQFELGQLVTTPFGCEDSTTLIRVCSADVTKPSAAVVTVDLGGQLPTDEGGTYSVAVTARDEAGNVTIDTFEYIVNADPEITSLIGPTSVEQGTNATFTVTFSDAPIDIHTVVFDWGNASRTTIDTGPGIFQASADITYGVPGTYTVGVTVTDDSGRSDSETRQITVENVAPIVTLTGPSPVVEGSSHTYSYEFTDPGTDAWSATVSCGDSGEVIAGSEVLNETLKTGSFRCSFADDDPTVTPSDISTVSVTVDDGLETGTAVFDVTVDNVAPTVEIISGPPVIDESTTDTYTYSYTLTDPGADTFDNPIVSCGADGTLTGLTFTDTGGSFECAWNDDTVNDVTVSVTDDDGGTGSDTLTVTVNNVAPTVTSVSAPIDPVNINDAVSVTVDWDDPGDDEHTIILDWGDLTETTVDTVAGERQVSVSHLYTAPGVYTIRATIRDDDGGSDSEVYQFVVVYNPDGGFVTGGGWIESPEGAYVPDPSLTGKATFGFVSKYKKGQSIPSGNTTFQFKTADFKFQSTSYDWLVITGGGRAQYKGSGTINGSGDYGFMLTAIDAAISQSTNDDLFRIKIWEKNGDGSEGTVIYDNKLGAPNADDPDTALGGGSIVIHDGKKK